MRHQLFLLAIVLATFEGYLSAGCRAKFSVQDVCHKVYGSLLGMTKGMSSAVQCASLCFEYSLCRSVLHIPDIKLCVGNSEKGKNFSSDCPSKVKYVEFQKATCRDVWMFEACVDDAFCPIPNSVCLNNRCNCQNGYNYTPCIDSCVAP